MPMSAPTEDRASERWCQASAFSALERIRRALFRVYQNIASLTAMDTAAAISATVPGAAAVSYPRLITLSTCHGASGSGQYFVVHAALEELIPTGPETEDTGEEDQE